MLFFNQLHGVNEIPLPVLDHRVIPLKLLFFTVSASYTDCGQPLKFFNGPARKTAYTVPGFAPDMHRTAFITTWMVKGFLSDG